MRMRNLFFIFLLFNISLNSAYSQNLSYYELMRITKIKSWSDINDNLSLKGYVYGGSKSDTIKTMVTWHRNCIDFEITSNWNTEWDYETHSAYSILLIYNYSYIVVDDFINNNYNIYHYYLNSKSSFNNFKSAAKKNGFKFVKDIVDDNNITSIYERKKLKSKEVLHLTSRRTGGYIVKYFPSFKISN